MLSKELFKLPKGLHPRIHSRQLDLQLGFNIQSIEDELIKDQRLEKDFNNTWIGLEPEILQTPYCEIFDLLSHFENLETLDIVDFGAAYGRMGIVCECFSNVNSFKGYEVEAKRCREGNRVFEANGILKSKLYNENIICDDFQIPVADIYFIYDFSSPSEQKQLLDGLAQEFMQRNHILVARGKGVNSLILNNYPEFHSMYPAHHTKTLSYYRSFSY